MKKKPSIGIIISVLGCVVLAALAVWMYRHADKTKKQFSRMENTVDEAIRSLDAIARSPQEPAAGQSAAAAIPQTETAAPEDERTADRMQRLPRHERASERLNEAVTEDETPSSDEEISESATEAGTRAAHLYSAPFPINHQIIFLGDSRTVGMGYAEKDLGDLCIYIGESGEGYDWLLEHGIEQLDEAIRDWPAAPVVINFGVNDCDAVNKYIEVYRELEKGYPDTDFYYLSVNPVTRESPHVPLEDVLAFNRKLRSAFPAQYIDSCSVMLEDGFDDVDGVHYTEEQYCWIHDFATRAVLRMQRQVPREPASE